ncbi:MAG: hypothetical protein K0R51_2945 [Cytophagaceae bacterium]|jgi:PKD repeat protein|nr:hypothetical protein [Cytophagaceae bacterium]
MKNTLPIILLLLALFFKEVQAQNDPIVDCEPSAEISYDKGYGCAGQKVSFTSSLSCLEATSWEWDFGDPSSGASNNSLVENPDHIFSANPAYQTYTVSLTINGTYTTSKNIYINTSPFADLGDDKIIHEGEIITLDSGYPINQWGIYNWSTNDNTPSIEVSSPGRYHVEVCTDDFLMGVCCAYDTVEVTLVLGVEEKENTDLYTLSPNPSSEYVMLKSKNNLEQASITIYTIYGQEVKRIKGINGHSFILNRENLPSGVYLLRLDQGQHLFTEKIIIKD